MLNTAFQRLTLWCIIVFVLLTFATFGLHTVFSEVVSVCLAYVLGRVTQNVMGEFSKNLENTYTMTEEE